MAVQSLNDRQILGRTRRISKLYYINASKNVDIEVVLQFLHK